MHVEVEAGFPDPSGDVDFTDGVVLELGQETIDVEQSVVGVTFEIVEVEQDAAAARPVELVQEASERHLVGAGNRGGDVFEDKLETVAIS